MPMPEFVRALRDKIGTDRLWLSGITAVVLRDNEILLARRADNGAWTPVTGIIDPGEEPAVAAVREVAEEAGVQTTVEHLVYVHTTGPVHYSNGDSCEYLDLVFRMRWDSGEPTPADGENSDVRWFPIDDTPELSADMRERIQIAVDYEKHARFIGPTASRPAR